LYGKREEARIGYNPHKRGRPSYHPLLCFEGHTKDFWHGELRPGDTHTKTGTLALLTACNEAYFHLLLFAYNVINRFTQLCLPLGFQTMKLRTLRTWLLLIPGELVRVGDRPLLKLPAHFLHRKTWDYAIKRIEMLKF
jgi:hypothetical protein